MIIDYLNDKSYYPAQGAGMASGLIGMIIWLFPLEIFSGITGYLLTIFTTGSTMFVGLVVTGLYKKHQDKILKFFEIKKPKFLRNGKRKKSNDQAA